jgi:hypothetical protein
MPENGSIDLLKTAISKRAGLAKPSRFHVEFTLPPGIGSGTSSDMTDLSIFCQSATIPTREINVEDYSTFRQSYKIPTGYKNVDVTCVFMLGNDMFPKNIFDSWLALTVDPTSYRIRFVEDYAATVNIYQLDESLNRIYGVQLNQAFPITVAPLDLDSNNTDQVHKLSVIFTYYDLLLLSGTDLTNASITPKSKLNINGSIGIGGNINVGGVGIGGGLSLGSGVSIGGGLSLGSGGSIGGGLGINF